MVSEFCIFVKEIIDLTLSCQLHIKYLSLYVGSGNRNKIETNVGSRTSDLNQIMKKIDSLILITLYHSNVDNG